MGPRKLLVQISLACLSKKLDVCKEGMKEDFGPKLKIFSSIEMYFRFNVL